MSATGGDCPREDDAIASGLPLWVVLDCLLQSGLQSVDFTVSLSGKLMDLKPCCLGHVEQGSHPLSLLGISGTVF